MIPGMSEDIDRGSAIPPYRQVAAILIERIREGHYLPGDRLPSVVDLTQMYGIARYTAQKALRLVIDEGYAEVSTGWGTFVRPGFPREGTSRAHDDQP